MKCIGRELEVQEMKNGRLLPIFRVGLRHIFLALCCDMVLCVATWVTGRRDCCVAIGIFPGRDIVIFLLSFCCDRVFPRCRDSVSFSIVTLSQQSLAGHVFFCRDRVWPSRMGSCHDRVFYVATELAKVGKISVTTEVLMSRQK